MQVIWVMRHPAILLKGHAPPSLPPPLHRNFGQMAPITWNMSKALSLWTLVESNYVLLDVHSRPPPLPPLQVGGGT